MHALTRNGLFSCGVLGRGFSGLRPGPRAGAARGFDGACPTGGSACLRPGPRFGGVPRGRAGAPGIRLALDGRRADRLAALLPAVALFLPGVAAHMVAILLPEAGAVAGHEFEAAHPLGAFPEVEVRDEEA